MLRRTSRILLAIGVQIGLVTLFGVLLMLRFRFGPAERNLWGFLPLLPTLLFIVCAAGAAGALLVFSRFRSDAARLAAVNGLWLFLGLGLLEGGGQMLAMLRPGYYALYLEPDAVTGWSPVPNLSYTWTGHYWYAVDFSVPIRTNSWGYRELEARLEKEPGTTRIALLGDSMVEAIQVPLQRTAGRILQDRLNARSAEARRAVSQPVRRPYEVLNFGVSSFGTGQCLLNWERTISGFHPDHVFIYVGGFHLERTVLPYETGYFASTRDRELNIRPTFRLDGGRLVREPPRDQAELIHLQERVLRETFGGNRCIRRKKGIYLEHFFVQLARILKHSVVFRLFPRAVIPTHEDAARVGLKVLEELGESVQEKGARLAIVDACLYHNAADEGLSRDLQRLAAERGWGYVPLSEALLARREAGQQTAWSFDGHFNETGNEIFAATMLRYLESLPSSKAPPARHASPRPKDPVFARM